MSRQVECHGGEAAISEGDSKRCHLGSLATPAVSHCDDRTLADAEPVKPAIFPVDRNPFEPFVFENRLQTQ